MTSSSDTTVIDNNNARSFEPLVEGQKVFAVTCPVLADTLFRTRLGDDFQTIARCYKQVLTAFAKHAVQGVVHGTVTAVGPVNGLGLQVLSVKADGPAVFETGPAFAEAGRPYDEFIARHSWVKDHGKSFETLMLSALAGEPEDPPTWLRYTALDEEERAIFAMDDTYLDIIAVEMRKDAGKLDEETSALLKATEVDDPVASDEAKAKLKSFLASQRPKYDTLCIAFPANETAKGFLLDIFKQVTARIRSDAQAEISKKSGYL